MSRITPYHTHRQTVNEEPTVGTRRKSFGGRSTTAGTRWPRPVESRMVRELLRTLVLFGSLAVIGVILLIMAIAVWSLIQT